MACAHCWLCALAAAGVGAAAKPVTLPLFVSTSLLSFSLLAFLLDMGPRARSPRRMEGTDGGNFTKPRCHTCGESRIQPHCPNRAVKACALAVKAETPNYTAPGSIRGVSPRSEVRRSRANRQASSQEWKFQRSANPANPERQISKFREIRKAGNPGTQKNAKSSMQGFRAFRGKGIHRIPNPGIQKREISKYQV